MGGGGLQDAWARSVAGYLSSYEAAQDRIRTILPLIGMAGKKTPATVAYAQTIMGGIAKRRKDTENTYAKKNYPCLAEPKAFAGAPRGAQRRLMDDFNSCGAYAAFDRYEISDIHRLAMYTSKQNGIYHLFIWANQKFRPNRLSREQHRFALCELIGIEHPALAKCSACGALRVEGSLEHTMRCAPLGGKAMIGGSTKAGVINGTRGSTNLRVPSWEPKYDNHGKPPPPIPGTTKAYVKKKADLEVQGYAGEVKLVDVTAAGAFPLNMTALQARTRGYLAKLGEERKVKETLGWKPNPKVEFVTFAVDLYGAVGPKALAFKAWLRKQTTPQEGNELENRVFGESHPRRFWEQVNIQMIKGCYAAVYKKSYGVSSVAKTTN
jgi:hypothetical protein